MTACDSFIGANARFRAANACYRLLRRNLDFWRGVRQMVDPSLFPSQSEVHQKQSQVVRSDKEARKRLAEALPQWTMFFLWTWWNAYTFDWLFVCLFVCWNKLRKAILRLLCWEGSKPTGSDHTRAEAQTTCVPKTAAHTTYLSIYG